MRISLLLVAAGLAVAQGTPAQSAEAQDAREAGIRAFRDVAAVLTSPRCLNCHVPGNAPLQGDDNHVHTMMVARGADGKGTPGMRCTNCHQESNVQTPHAPPGASEWRMPTAATPMAWQGLTTAQLCRVLADPATNGKRSLLDLVEHVTSDKIVNWGWNPGPGRTVPPLSHQQFVEAVKRWAAAGGPCPE
jgi:hypothetical protein